MTELISNINILTEKLRGLSDFFKSITGSDLRDPNTERGKFFNRLAKEEEINSVRTQIQRNQALQKEGIFNDGMFDYSELLSKIPGLIDEEQLREDRAKHIQLLNERLEELIRALNETNIGIAG